MQTYEYLIDVAPDTFHQPIGFGNFGAVGSEINPCSHAITDVLGLVLITELFALGKNILHFRFGEADIEGVGFLFPLAIQILAFVLGKLILGLNGKALVKLGSDLFIKRVIDSSVIGHTCGLI